MQFFSYRSLNFVGFMIIVCLLLMALYLQQHGIEPCPLCIIQRFIFFILGLLFFLGTVYEPSRKWRVINSVVILILALFGAFVASRQVWLQHLPTGTAPACGPGLYYIIQNLPLSQAVQMIFRGTADCATVTWTLLGFSVAEWSLAFFISFIFLAFIQGARK